MAKRSSPVVIFLHGLLGSREDWREVVHRLTGYECIALDLPFHGQSTTVVGSLYQSAVWLEQELSVFADRIFFLVGYSLGGRIAAYYLFHYPAKYLPRALILEGVNAGLTSEEEKQQRWNNDYLWAKRFISHPLQQVLEQWYQQPVFTSLTLEQRECLIAQRLSNQGENIAAMLRATSLAKQPDLATKIRQSAVPVHYLCGEKDEKFYQIATMNQFNLTLIQAAGHNSHQENPVQFAECLTALLNQYI